MRRSNLTTWSHGHFAYSPASYWPRIAPNCVRIAICACDTVNSDMSASSSAMAMPMRIGKARLGISAPPFSSLNPGTAIDRHGFRLRRDPHRRLRSVAVVVRVARTRTLHDLVDGQVEHVAVRAALVDDDFVRAGHYPFYRVDIETAARDVGRGFICIHELREARALAFGERDDLRRVGLR